MRSMAGVQNSMRSMEEEEEKRKLFCFLVTVTCAKQDPAIMSTERKSKVFIRMQPGLEAKY
jgi:hypothetical protein